MRLTKSNFPGLPDRHILGQTIDRCLTSRTVCELHIVKGFGVYIQVHGPYDSYDSYGSLVRVVKQWLTSRTVCELHIIRGTWGVYTSPRPVRLVRVVTQFNGLRVVQFVNCISLEGLGVYIQVHDSYDSYVVTKRRNDLQPPKTTYYHLEKFNNNLQPPRPPLDIYGLFNMEFGCLWVVVDVFEVVVDGC